MTSVESQIEHIADLLGCRMESMEETSHTEGDAAKKKSYEALLESMSRYEDTFDDANNDYICDECDYVLVREGACTHDHSVIISDYARPQPRDAKAAFRISHFGRSAAPPTCTAISFQLYDSVL